MECNDEDEDDDIKMGMAGVKKPKLAKQNTLTKYFVKGKQEKVSNKPKVNEQVQEIQPMNVVNDAEDKMNESQNQNKKEQSKKKKKRRVVMCELIE